MLSPQQFSKWVSEHRSCFDEVGAFDLEWLGGRFCIIEAKGALWHLAEQAPESVAAVEVVGEPQMMHLLIDFELAGRKPSPLVESKRAEADALLMQMSPTLKVGMPRVETTSLMKSQAPLIYESTGGSMPRLFAGNETIVCLFRFHQERLASALIADVRQLPGFVYQADDPDWFMKAIRFLWEGPGTSP